MSEILKWLRPICVRKRFIEILLIVYVKGTFEEFLRSAMWKIIVKIRKYRKVIRQTVYNYAAKNISLKRVCEYIIDQSREKRSGPGGGVLNHV